MNHIFRIVWNSSHTLWQLINRLARGSIKSALQSKRGLFKQVHCVLYNIDIVLNIRITVFIFSTITIHAHAEGLVSLTDHQLSEETGQALFNLSYIAPTDSTNLESQRADGVKNIGFYKLGMEAVVDVNANIKKLQLGCGGVNGAGDCDIDIDNISLSGIPANSNYTAADRTATSAQLTNPFIEFAIANPDSAATRQMKGFRLSAEKIVGLMTLGTDNSVDANGNGSENGINTFSGYMKTKASSGIATTQARNMTYADTGLKIEGKVAGWVLFPSTCPGGPTCAEIKYESTEYNLALTSTSAPFTIPTTVISGTRMKEAYLTGSGTVGQINFNGELYAAIKLGELTLPALRKDVTGNITGLKTAITVDQDLGYIHALTLNNPASLSLQSQNILWPGASAVANRGWWLAFEDEVDLGNLSPVAQVAISNQVLQQTIAGISADLTNNPRYCGELITGCTFTAALDVGNIPLNNTILDFPLTDLVLQGQNFRPNCWGNLKFC